MHTATRSRLEVIDGLRGIAIFLVAWFHFWQISWWSTPLDFIATTGALGVELFFFLSAFCLFYSYHHTLPEYAFRRAIKILPSYFLAIILIFIFATPAFSSSKEALKHLGLHLLFIHNLWPDSMGSINGVFWSLGVEVQFYVLFPFLCIVFRKKPFLMVGLLSALAIAFRVWMNISFQSRYEFYMNQLPGFMDLFIFGMLAAYCAEKWRDDTVLQEKLRPYFTPLAVFSAVALLLMMYEAHTQRFQPGIPHWKMFHRTLFAFFLFLLTIGSLYAKNIWKRILANRVLVFLSTISYNLYIWHQLIGRKLLAYRMPAFATPDPHNDPHWQVLFTIAAWIAAVAFSAVVTYAFERPLLKLKFSHFFSTPKENL